MDPLTGVVLAVLTAYATDKGKELLDTVGEASLAKGKQIFARLKSAWSGNSTVSRDLEAFAEEPETYSAVIAKRINATLGADPSLREEIESLIEEDRPQVDVFQKIAKSVGVIGADIGEVKSGKVNVEQEITESHDVTGARIRKLGK